MSYMISWVGSMKIPEVNRILSMYNIQVKREVGRWYIASVYTTEGNETLWGQLTPVEYSAEEVCEYVLNHVDAIRRFNGE